MSTQEHLKTWAFFTVGWVGFVLVGWPSYYQDWSRHWLILFCITVYFFVGIILLQRLRSHQDKSMSRGLWTAFYISLPLLVYDYFFVSFYLREPFDLLNRFWFLSVFYIVPWIQTLVLYCYVQKTAVTKMQCAGSAMLSVFVGCIAYYILAVASPEITDPLAGGYSGKLPALGIALAYSVLGTAILTLLASIVLYCRIAGAKASRSSWNAESD